MDLCNALLLWYENQEYGSPKKAVVEDPIYLFKKVSYINCEVIYQTFLFLKKILKGIISNKCMTHVVNSDK